MSLEKDDDSLKLPERPDGVPYNVEGTTSHRPGRDRSGREYFTTSVLYLLSQSFGLTLGLFAFLLGASAAFLLAVLVSSPLLGAILTALVAGVAVVVVTFASAGAFRLLSQRLQEADIEPWPARLFVIAVASLYASIFTALAIFIFILATASEDIKYPLAIAGLCLVAITASQVYIPGCLAGAIGSVSASSAKGLSLIVLVVVALGAVSFTGGGVILAASAPKEEKADTIKSQARSETIARRQLLGASQASQNFLIDRDRKKTRAGLAQYLCSADYQIDGQEQSCIFSSVSPLPILRSSSKKIFIGPVNTNTVELCLRGGKRFFCTLTGPGAVWRGWSAFGFDNARSGSKENLGWPNSKMSQEQSELERAINGILGQIESNEK